MTSIKNTLSVTDARRKLFEIVEAVSSPANVYTLTERGAPKAVVMSATEYESWVETMEVMRDCPTILKDIKESRAAMRSGAWRSWPTLESILRDEQKIAYGLSTRRKIKRKKRAR